MSEPKIISPLLDNFLMGDPISEHSGIRCCPAMDPDTEQKYIVKIISLPSSETQLNALLLTGVLKSEEDAQIYFEERTQDLVKEIEILQKLSRQEGFLPYEGYQIVSNEESVGFDVYILSKYKRSLERQFQKKPLTHLEALNIGLDMCSALTACRRSGYLFVNLKPSNIYVTENGEYKISDLGFVSLKSLKYATILEHYIGSYTPPELTDAFSALNDTVDVYALGMILYRIYNGGFLPEITDQPLPTPAYADEEMAEIILKACCQNPAERWKDPVQMGQMLVNYMQKNGASNEPIVPPAALEEDIQSEDVTDSGEILEEASAEHIDAAESEIPADEKLSEAVRSSPADAETDDAEIAAEAADIEIDDAESISYEDLTEEVSEILSQADELASMSVPEPVVAPEPIEVVLPVSEEAEETDEQDSEASDEESETESEEDTDEESPAEDYEEDDYTPPHRSHWLRNTLLALVGVCLLAGGFLFYHFFFMKTIDDLEVIGSKNTLTVYVETKADESLLTISCTDLYGKTIIVPVVNGSAEFSGLLANAEYTVEVNIKGFHGVKGETTAKYFTPTETSIVQYNVVTGTIPGTAILSFTVNGPDSDSWRFTYGSSDADRKTVDFSGHTITLTDLVEDKVYTGVLEPDADLFIAQTPEISFTATEVIQATNLIITSCTDGKLSAKWSVPESAEVEGWNVRCYNGDDYDQTLQTTDTSIEFTGLDNSDGFTVEVTAIGQSFVQSTSIGENSVTVQNLAAENTSAGVIALQWEAPAVPDGGWIVSYTVDGSETVMSTTSSENRAVIKPSVPDAEYIFTVRAADSTPTVCEPCIFQTAKAENFTVNYAGNVVTKDNLRFSLCKRPALSSWSYLDLQDTDYTTAFRIGENAGFVVFLNRRYDLSDEIITTAFVIRDENEQIVSISSTEETWTDMWYKNYCELSIPSMPNTAGKYTISVYFNGQFAVKQAFSVVEA